MFRTIAASLALAVAVSLPASATTLYAGDNAAPSVFSTSGLTLLATNTPAVVTGSSATFTATYQSGVFTDTNNIYCAGCLDFSFYIANNTGSPQGIIESISSSNYGSFLTNVGYASSGAGSIAPDMASRSSDGSVVKFYFANLTPGTTADYLLIQTNATAYTTGDWSIQDGSSLPLKGFEPTTSVTPEPSSLILLGTGLLSAAGVARRKFRL